jgi:hypothetical protein
VVWDERRPVAVGGALRFIDYEVRRFRGIVDHSDRAAFSRGLLGEDVVSFGLERRRPLGLDA